MLSRGAVVLDIRAHTRAPKKQPIYSPTKMEVALTSRVILEQVARQAALSISLLLYRHEGIFPIAISLCATSDGGDRPILYLGQM